MKAKELKNLAKKIAKYEWIIQNSEDKKAILDAQTQIMKLSGCVDKIEDMVAIDELVQEYIKELS